MSLLHQSFLVVTSQYCATTVKFLKYVCTRTYVQEVPTSHLSGNRTLAGTEKKNSCFLQRRLSQ